MPGERICRGCEKVRTPPIEGPCPHCKGYFRTILKRRRGDGEEDGLPEGPMSVSELIDRHADDEDLAKQPTGLPGMDYVFDGGLPQRGTILLAAIEGSGKTSLLWEVLLVLAGLNIRSIYFSGEQDGKDHVAQFGRLGHERIRRAGRRMKIDTTAEFDDILDGIEKYKPKVVAIDSLHWVEGVYDDHDQPMKSGSPAAVERVAKEIKRLSGKLGFLAFLVCHMNNDGSLSGGAHLRYAVDAKLVLDRWPRDEDDPRRLLRFEGKSRFGRVGRVALFEMTDDGFKDRGPFLKKEKKDRSEQGERRPGEDGQVLRFPGRKKPPVKDESDDPEPPTAA